MRVTIAEILHAASLGLGTGLGLIVAIGAQNAFVLRQGIRSQYVAAVVAVCAVSDAALIACGVLGTGTLFKAVPEAMIVLRIVGAAFLLTYGALAARRAFRPQALVVGGAGDGTVGDAPAADGMGAQAGGPPSRRGLVGAVVTVLALTWLNPHVYLDTVVLLGAVAGAQAPGLQWWFGGGAMLGSVLWFSALGFGARFLRTFFARPASWRILDGGIAVVMTAIGTTLLVNA